MKLPEAAGPIAVAPSWMIDALGFVRSMTAAAVPRTRRLRRKIMAGLDQQ
jgi:hypothetical protein